MKEISPEKTYTFMKSKNYLKLFNETNFECNCHTLLIVKVFFREESYQMSVKYSLKNQWKINVFKG